MTREEIDKIKTKIKECAFTKTLKSEDYFMGKEDVDFIRVDTLFEIIDRYADNSDTSGDLISREAAIKALDCDISIMGTVNAQIVAKTIQAFVFKLKRLPSIPQKTGRWIKLDRPWKPWYKCSRCGFKRPYFSNYCPYCGADMREAEE